MQKVLFFVAGLVLVSCARQEPPLVYGVENSGNPVTVTCAPFEELAAQPELPNPFMFANGKAVKKFQQWESRRQEILSLIQQYEVGTKPETSKDCITAEILPWQEPVTPRPVWIGFDGKPFHSPYEDMHPDTLVVTIVENGETLAIHCPVYYPEGDGPFPAVIGIGQGAGSLSPGIFRSRNIAMIGYPFQEVMSHTQTRGNEPINRLYPDLEYIGAYSAWPWGISRVIDALEILGESSKVDLSHLAVTGCSFAGKMALFAGAFDERIALTIAQEPGGGGVATWRFSETLGEVERVKNTNYSWFIEDMKRFSDCVEKLPVDHHELCALVCPRALLVFGNPDYPWLADESGYVSCSAARKVWEKFGIADRMGYSFQDKHGHCALPESQYPELEAFIDRFLLDRPVETICTKAPMFSTDLAPWMSWAAD